MAIRTIHGSAHNTGLPDKSIHCVLTSPPYYRLRTYSGGDEQVIDWPEVAYSPMPGLPPVTVPPMRCALGDEPDATHYIGHLVLCLREWQRVLRNDGTLWLNLGDSFTGSGGAGGDYNEGGSRAGQPKFKGGRCADLPPKNMMMIPARFALAAQADGWTLRSDVIWSKPNCQTESTRDRPTRSHEHIYLLTKNRYYFYDGQAIVEPSKSWGLLPRDENGEVVRGKAGRNALRGQEQNREEGGGRAMRDGRDLTATGYGPTRSKRDVWEVALIPYQGAHYAAWPETLAETIIRAGTSARGCCAMCGAPWERVVERSAMKVRRTANHPPELRTRVSGTVLEPPTAETVGWRPTCRCNCEEVSPAVVLDPFCGSGTTLRVAERLGRDSVGIDTSSEYLNELVPRRVSGVQKMLILE